MAVTREVLESDICIFVQAGATVALAAEAYGVAVEFVEKALYRQRHGRAVQAAKHRKALIELQRRSRPSEAAIEAADKKEIEKTLFERQRMRHCMTAWPEWHRRKRAQVMLQGYVESESRESS